MHFLFASRPFRLLAHRPAWIALCLFAGCGKPPVPMTPAQLRANSASNAPAPAAPPASLHFGGRLRLDAELAAQSGAIFFVARNPADGAVLLARKYDGDSPDYVAAEGGQRDLSFHLDEQYAMAPHGGAVALPEVDLEILYDLDGSVDTKGDILVRTKHRVRSGDDDLRLELP